MLTAEVGSDGPEQFSADIQGGSPSLTCEINEIIDVQTLGKATKLLAALSPAAPEAPISASPPPRSLTS